MRFRSVVVALMITSGALLAQAAKLDGTWTGQGTSPVSEPMPVTLHFTSNGPALEGYWVTEDGNKVPLQDLEVEGGKVSFWFSAGEYDMIANGVATADEIRLKVTMDVIGITFDAVLTRK